LCKGRDRSGGLSRIAPRQIGWFANAKRRRAVIGSPV
jgi:hypothetical protein